MLEMSNDRSLSGTSLAVETLALLFLWIQQFAPWFLESLDAARTSAYATPTPVYLNEQC